VSCGYNDRPVLRDVSFDIRPGEIVALLGPNGSGKTTLLRTILKTIPALGGEVSIEGRSLNDFDYQDLARKVAFVPQEESPTFGFLVKAAVAMGRMPISGGFFDTADDVEKALEAMSLTDCLSLQDRSIQELSAGELQRVWIARAIAQGAPVLLMDEPSSHLDPAHQLTLIQIAKDLASRGLAIVAAVHDLNLAAAMANRAILLCDGKIGVDAPMAEILTDPMLEQAYGVRFAKLMSEFGTRVFPESSL
jgi:iron complex transport system ATP-binding protein